MTTQAVKPIVKIQVIREYTEKEIVGLGSTYLLKRKAKVWMLMVLCALVMTTILTRVLKSGLIEGIIDILPVIVVFGVFWYKSQQMGKKILKYVLDTPQPVKLEF